MKYIIRDQTFKKARVLAITEMFTMALMILPQFKAIFMLIPSPEWGRAPKMKKLDHLTNNEKKKIQILFHLKFPNLSVQVGVYHILKGCFNFLKLLWRS